LAVGCAAGPIFGTVSNLFSSPKPTQALGDLHHAVKGLRLETHHSPPPTAKLQNEWIYTSTPPPGFLQCTGKMSMYFAIFQASAAVQWRPWLFWDVTWGRLAVLLPTLWKNVAVPF
jgi:hypothetical protein